MTRRERLERKMERRQEWSEGRAAKAHDRWNAADLSEEKSGIPLGQPILVGHHSEKRHRRVLERADNAMRKASEHHDMAKHHASKADGLARQLDTSIFSDDDDAITRLQERIDINEARRKQNNAINAIIRKKPRAERTPEKIAALIGLGLKEATAEKLFEHVPGHGKGVPAYVNQNLGGRIKADRDRIARIKRDRETKAKAEDAPGGVVIEGGDYVSVTFAEKPEREILRELKAAGFRWGCGSWTGRRENLPDCVAA